MNKEDITFDKFIVKTSNGEIKVDGTEIPKIIEGITSGSIIILKQGILNPSFLVSIIPDEQRVSDIKKMIESVDKQNKLVGMRAGDKIIEKVEYKEELVLLPDLFKETLANDTLRLN